MKMSFSVTSATIGAWKCNFPPYQEIMTDRLTNQPTHQYTEMRGNREVTLNKEPLHLLSYFKVHQLFEMCTN